MEKNRKEYVYRLFYSTTPMYATANETNKINYEWYWENKNEIWKELEQSINWLDELRATIALDSDITPTIFRLYYGNKYLTPAERVFFYLPKKIIKKTHNINVWELELDVFSTYWEDLLNTNPKIDCIKRHLQYDNSDTKYNIKGLDFQYNGKGLIKPTGGKKPLTSNEFEKENIVHEDGFKKIRVINRIRINAGILQEGDFITTELHKLETYGTIIQNCENSVFYNVYFVFKILEVGVFALPIIENKNGGPYYQTNYYSATPNVTPADPMIIDNSYTQLSALAKSQANKFLGIYAGPNFYSLKYNSRQSSTLVDDGVIISNASKRNNHVYQGLWISFRGLELNTDFIENLTNGKTYSNNNNVYNQILKRENLYNNVGGSFVEGEKVKLVFQNGFKLYSANHTNIGGLGTIYDFGMGIELPDTQYSKDIIQAKREFNMGLIATATNTAAQAVNNPISGAAFGASAFVNKVGGEIVKRKNLKDKANQVVDIDTDLVNIINFIYQNKIGTTPENGSINFAYKEPTPQELEEFQQNLKLYGMDCNDIVDYRYAYHSYPYCYIQSRGEILENELNSKLLKCTQFIRDFILKEFKKGVRIWSIPPTKPILEYDK